MYMYRMSREDHFPEYPEGLSNSHNRSDSEQKIADQYWGEAEKLYPHLEEVMYWRKTNFLHNWLVNQCQNGIDQCQYAEVTKADLQDAIDILQESLDTKEPLMRPTSGFFFGSTAVDEWYWKDVEKTLDTFNALMEETDFKKERLVYSSSW